MGFSRQEYWSGVPIPSPSAGINTRRSARKEGYKEKRGCVYRGLCGDLGKDAELGAERRKGPTWRSGCALQAARSKVLGLSRVEFPRTEKTAFQCDGNRGGGDSSGGAAGGA